MAHITHLSEEAVWSNIKRIWTWPSMKSDWRAVHSKCGECQENRRSKNKSVPILPLDLQFFGPGDYWTSDLYEVDKKDYITVTDRISGLIISEQIKNKSSKETVRAIKSFMWKLGVPMTLRSDNGSNYMSNEFAAFCREYGINHTTSSPYYHEGNGASEKSVDTLKRMMRKSKNKLIEELTYHLNHNARKGQSASPIQMFFGRDIRGPLPNQYKRDCEIRKTIELRVQKQMDVASRRGRWNRDSFELNDPVRIKDMNTNRWDIKGKITEVKSDRAYVVTTTDGNEFHRNASHIHHRSTD